LTTAGEVEEAVDEGDAGDEDGPCVGRSVRVGVLAVRWEELQPATARKAAAQPNAFRARIRSSLRRSWIC
jgi:hypothetical protein